MVALQTQTAWLDADEVPGPPLPLGERVELVGRGTTFVRRVAGPEGAPTVLLVHGWCASGGLNWYQAFEPLGEHFSVLAPDLRGHGRGLRTNDRFRLRDCADDLAALIEAEGCGPVIAVGYSMGGPISQLLWKRHTRPCTRAVGFALPFRPLIRRSRAASPARCNPRAS